MPRYERIPLSPNLDALKDQAKNLLDRFKSGDPEARSDFEACHPRRIAPEQARLGDARLTIARAYGFPGWPRLCQASQLCAAVSAGRIDEVRQLVTEHPRLLAEEARREGSSWGSAMAFASSLGQTEIVEMLADLNADEVQFAFDRAVLQGKTVTARALMNRGAAPVRGIVMNPCETLNSEGLQFVLDHGAEPVDREGDRTQPVRMVLHTYSRNPQGKHECLRILESSGFDLQDTPMMNFHRGSIDRLESNLREDPELVRRRYSYRDIYPPHICGPDVGLHGTPIGGTTLLHMAIDFDEEEIFAWLLRKGADPNARAEAEANGFGGHTPLFNCVVKQPGRMDGKMARTLLDRGADPSVRASIRKALKLTDDESVHEYRNVTPVEYGEQFQNRRWVNEAAVKAVREHIAQR